MAIDPQQTHNQLSANMETSNGTNLQETNFLTPEAKSSPNQSPIFSPNQSQKSSPRNIEGSYLRTQPSLIPHIPQPTDIVNQPHHENPKTDKPKIVDQRMKMDLLFEFGIEAGNDVGGYSTPSKVNYIAPV